MLCNLYEFDKSRGHDKEEYSIFLWSWMHFLKEFKIEASLSTSEKRGQNT